MPSWSASPRPCRPPRNSRSCRPRRPKSRRSQLPGLEDALRDAQQRSNQQRSAVAEVQQQIQVLAAESRSLDEQSRQLQQRSERLGGERQGLALPDLQKLEQLQPDSAALHEGQALAEARLHELGEQVQALDEQRRAQAQTAATEASRQAELGARLEALRALQDKVQSSGKLKPWLVKHGLDSLQGLWTRVHIEPGWETALEAALRERLNALEVGRLETVRAFAADAPPTRLAFYSSNAAAIANTHRTLPRLSELLRLNDAGLQALLNDWLEGVYTAPSLDEALAARSQLTHGEVIMSREGHAVSQYAVSFYAPDSEQAGMLARQQEIENLERQLRAQGLIADEARSASVRVEAAYTEASLRLASARREAAEAQTRAHQTQVELLRLRQQAEASQARRSQLDGELAELGAQLDELRERRARARRASRSWTSNWPTRSSATATSTMRSSPPSAGSTARASSSARWSARRRRPPSSRARWWRARANCSAPSTRRSSRWRPTCRPPRRSTTNWPVSTTPPRRPGCRPRWR